MRSHYPGTASRDDQPTQNRPAGSRVCAVCFVEQVSTVALPCRHSVMCSGCMDNVKSSRGICPLCRCPIDMSLTGHFAAEFVDLAPEMVAAAYEPLRQAQEAVYKGMYQHIRVFLLIGIICGACSLLCFVLAPFLLLLAPLLLLPGCFLAGLGFCIGYIPWLAVSIVAFEEQRAFSLDGRQQLFTREDLRKPWRIAVKIAIVAAAGPLACISFFIPYALYAGILRTFAQRAVPVFSHLLIRALLDASCYSYMYAIRPAFQLAARLLVSVKASIRRVMQRTHVWRRRCSRAIAQVARSLFAHAGNVAKWIGRAVITPTWHAILKPCGSAAASAAIWTYDNVLRHLLLFSHQRLTEAAYFLSRLRCAAVTCMSWACANILHPALSAAHQVAAIAAELIASGAGMVYLHVLSPSGKLLSWMVACCSLLRTSLQTHVVVPVWRIMSDIASTTVVPCCNLFWAVGSSVNERFLVPAAHEVLQLLHALTALAVQVLRQVSHIIFSAAQEIAQAFGSYGRG
eukprot:TRINITY_DN74548_c0_g1_i1.p1 TRINITY_DN74548_c0_g1~~TRINITY_DN74548_c0_g1_i1.p1  ORF type:complete len:514 (-),score=45.14 TRINITY_DN74548_c0_g1_i1:172-1713(-)